MTNMSKKCHLNTEIKCKYSDFCKKKGEIISEESFLEYWKEYSKKNYNNEELMIYLLKNKYIPCIIDVWKSLNEILQKKRIYKKEIWDYNYFIWYSSRRKFTLHVYKKNSKLNTEEILSKIYPKCCSDEYYKNNWSNWVLDLESHIVFPKILWNSRFYCPMLIPNFFLNEWDITFFSFPYYQMCSFDCNKTIDYAQNILSLISEKDISKLFKYLKLPFIIKWGNIIFVNWYYDSWVLFYEWIFVNKDWNYKYIKRDILKKWILRSIIFPWYNIKKLIINNIQYRW